MRGVDGRCFPVERGGYAGQERGSGQVAPNRQIDVSGHVDGVVFSAASQSRSKYGGEIISSTTDLSIAGGLSIGR